MVMAVVAMVEAVAVAVAAMVVAVAMAHITTRGSLAVDADTLTV